MVAILLVAAAAAYFLWAVHEPTIQVPNFAGTWESFDSSYNGGPYLPKGERLTITQNGSIVHVFNRDLMITGADIVTFATFYAGPSPGHSVQSEGQADLIDTVVLMIKGDVLIYKATFNYRRQYGTHGPGVDTRVVKYRRVSA